MKAITSEPNRVILSGDWGEEIILDIAWSQTENIDDFKEAFEVVQGEHLRNEDYYQGLRRMAVIRRKSDGKLFGYPFFDDISKHGESYVEANGDDHDLDYGDYVWLPVEPFLITGYQFAQDETL